jgi:predicted N-formylglutamate amidohydrolase
LDRHIGWDIGAEPLTRRLADRFDAPAIIASYSRLVIDCNRALSDPSCISEASDGTLVPGNADLSPTARAERSEAIYWPYHRRIALTLDGFAARGVVPAVISIHSFTPSIQGVPRPWQVGVLWDADQRISAPLLRALRENEKLIVGDNQPYSLRGPTDFTLPYHAVPRGLAHVLVEVRQDEITTTAGVSRFAEILDRALSPLWASPG